MADIVSSLFGLSPREQYARDRQQEFEMQARTMSGMYDNQYDRQNAYLGSKLGSLIGQGVGNLFGLQDPALKRMSGLEGVLQEAQQELGQDMADPTKLYPTLADKLQQRGFGREAAMVTMQGQEAINDFQTKQAQRAKAQADAEKIALQTQQDAAAQQAAQQVWQKAQQEGRTPTNEEVISAVAPFVSADKLAPMMQGASDKAAYRDSMIQQAQLAAESRIEAAKERGATQLQIAQMRADSQKDLAQFKAELKSSIGPEYKSYDNLDDKINDPQYGVATEKVPAREKTVARRVVTDAHEVSQGVAQIKTLTEGGMRDVTGTVFANVKDTGFTAATGKLFANTINPKERAMYDAMMYPLVKGLVLYSNPDYRPTQADVVNGMASYKANAGESHVVQLAKMAELKKNFEAASESFLDSHFLNPSQASAVKKQLRDVQNAIPWQVDDVTSYMRDPKAQQTPFKTWLNSRKKASKGTGSFEAGKVYTDAKGNKAMYQQDGTWKDVK
jgi:hypothetical protein